jgi:hypothetical protein
MTTHPIVRVSVAIGLTYVTVAIIWALEVIIFNVSSGKNGASVDQEGLAAAVFLFFPVVTAINLTMLLILRLLDKEVLNISYIRSSTAIAEIINIISLRTLNNEAYIFMIRIVVLLSFFFVWHFARRTRKG